MVDNKNLEDDEIKDKIEEETLEEVKEEEQDLEDIKKVLEEALGAEEEANATDDASKDSKDAKIADLEANQKQDYIMQVIGALENPTYNKLLIPEDNKALWIGDFNSSMQLKNEIDKNNHTRFLETMKKYGLVSAYHTNRQKKHGKEDQFTFIGTYRNGQQRFFNDYIFYHHDRFKCKTVTIGRFNTFSFFSDHCPVLAELQLL